MIEIKQLISIDDDFYSYFSTYFIRSKPYDFCELKSIALRKFKIKEYLDILSTDSYIYKATTNSKIICYVVFSKEKNNLVLEFAIGDHQFSPSFLVKYFHKILILAQKTFDKQIIKSTIQRRYKRKSFINWIKRYDKVCEITESNNTIEINWKYERLNHNCRNE